MMPLSFRVSGSLALLLSAPSMAASCRRSPEAAGPISSEPTLRLYVISTAAGALEPCGCTKDQLGGVDHAAAFVGSESKHAPHALVVGAGPMLFLDPLSEASRGTQDLWKDQALATSLGHLGLLAWAPGENDWAAGPSELERLKSAAHADLLAGNLHGATAGAKATRIVAVGGYRVGLAGASDPTGPLGGPAGVEGGDPRGPLAAEP